MNRRAALVVLLTLAVAGLSLWSLVTFRQGPAAPGTMAQLAWYAALGVVLAASAVAFWSTRWPVLAAALAVVLAAGFLPRLILTPAPDGTVAEQAAPPAAPSAPDEQPAPPAAAVPALPPAGLAGYAAEVETRRTAADPWDADEGYAFLEFVGGEAPLPGDATTLSERLPLLRQALADDVLDPDALTTAAPVADSPAVTLTLLWYDRAVRPGAPDAIPRGAWEVLMALVAGGADIASDAAGELRADLSKTVIDSGGDFIGLAWGEIAPPVEPVAPAGEAVVEPSP